VTPDRFADRLDTATCEQDEVVGIYESTPDDGDSLWLSEFLGQRLAHSAAAYELHTLPMIGGSDEVKLNKQRCQELVDELAFMADRLDDASALATAQAIQHNGAQRLRRPTWTGHITFDGN
jgi:hypothetical protein